MIRSSLYFNGRENAMTKAVVLYQNNTTIIPLFIAGSGNRIVKADIGRKTKDKASLPIIRPRVQFRENLGGILKSQSET